jgi:hypothetical protein
MKRVQIIYNEFSEYKPLYELANRMNIHIQPIGVYKQMLWLKEEDFTEEFKQFLLESILRGLKVIYID